MCVHVPDLATLMVSTSGTILVHAGNDSHCCQSAATVCNTYANHRRAYTVSPISPNSLTWMV